MPKDNENYDDLLKVPDSVIIKSLRTEVGKLNAYIIELEEAAKEELEAHDTSGEIKALKQQVEEVTANNRTWKNKCSKLRKMRDVVNRVLDGEAEAIKREDMYVKLQKELEDSNAKRIALEEYRDKTRFDLIKQTSRKLTTSEKAIAATAFIEDRFKGDVDTNKENYINFILGMQAAEELLMGN